MHPADLWSSTGWKERLLRGALTPASWGYAFGWEAYLGAYTLGLKRAKKSDLPVICVGNLQAGGSGKTPFVLWLASYLESTGRKVVISCSGYGSPHAEAAALAPEGEILARQWGDEPALFRWKLPEIPLIVGRRRVLAAEIAEKNFPSHILLLDDGFQHLPLKKDLTIILDPINPINSHCLPAGPYREPRWNRMRADLLVPGDLTIESRPTRLSDPGGQPQNPERYSVLCAIGNPGRFLADLENFVPSKNGFGHVSIKTDHDSLRDGKLLSAFSAEVPIVVTAKDWVKIRERDDHSDFRFLIASQEITVKPLEVIERRISESCPRS